MIFRRFLPLIMASLVMMCSSCALLNENVTKTVIDERDSVDVPILMYHHIAEEGNNDTIISAKGFEEHIAALSAAGYTAVFYEDLIAYVNKGEALPEKPIVITFDDGYDSNLTIAAPILEKYEMCGTIAVVGVTEGASSYKDTGVAITPHFSLDDERVSALMKKGIIDIQMHTYDMHRVKSLDGEDCRIGAVIMDGESEADYVAALTKDYNKIHARILDSTGRAPIAYTYPHGKYSELSEKTVKSLGAIVTVTTDTGINKIVKGDPESLYLLKRYNISDAYTGNALVELISG